MSARVGELGGGEEAGGCIGTSLSGIVIGDEKREGRDVKNAKLTEERPCAAMCHDASRQRTKDTR